jgi:lipopolysaccharide export system permease protein
MKKLIFKNFYTDLVSFFFVSLITMSIIVWILQAVNYFDFVSEDGHGLKIYFYFTLLNFPKVVDRIMPFMFFISLFYTIYSYEQKNELNIFWFHGVSKILFINKIIFFSLFIMFVQIISSSIISPSAQFKSRDFLKNSKIDFFSNLIKEEKFINVVENLTIFINKKDKNGMFEDIFLHDSRNKTNKTIFAKKGILIEESDQKIFRLTSGKVINKDNDRINIFKFDEIDFNLSDFTSRTITVPKIQEIPTLTLLSCLNSWSIQKIIAFKCDNSLNDEVKQEFLKRLFKPIYIPLIGLFCGLLILNSKFKQHYKKKNNLIFISIFIIIFLSEISLRLSTTSQYFFIYYISIPLIIFLITYKILNKILKT